MDYLYKIKDSVSQLASQASKALPGNQITKEYEIFELIGTAGPSLMWNIYRASKKSTKQRCAVWIFEKKKLDNWPKNERERFIELLKEGTVQLTRFRHPKLLRIEHSLEESRESIAFASEPLLGSLSSILVQLNKGNDDPDNINKLEDVEIRHGLLGLAEALSFLHLNAKVLHRNICANSILINTVLDWKLASFEYCVGMGNNADNNMVPTESFPHLACSSSQNIVTQMDLAFPSDIFGLGLLCFEIYNGKPLYDNQNKFVSFKNNPKQQTNITTTMLAKVPSEFHQDLRSCLAIEPNIRPDANEFTKMAYFDNVYVKTLNYFENLIQLDHNQKIVFYKGLVQVLDKFPKRCLFHKIISYLSFEFSTPNLIPFILPAVFRITELGSKSEFKKYILPKIVGVFPLEQPYQISLLLLQKMSLLMEKMADEDIKTHILPLIYNSLLNDNVRIQELCLDNIPTIAKVINRESMNKILPRLIKLATEGVVLSIKVQTLVCISKLLPNLEPWMVSDQIVPALPKINCREPGIMIAVLGIYQLAFENERFGLSSVTIGKIVLPYLISASVENTLNISQYEMFMMTIKKFMVKMENDQRSKLQLSSGQENSRTVPNFTELVNQITKQSENTVDPSIAVESLDEFFGKIATVDKKETISSGKPIQTTQQINVQKEPTQKMPPSNAFDFTEFYPSNNTSKPNAESFANIKIPAPPSTNPQNKTSNNSLINAFMPPTKNSRDSLMSSNINQVARNISSNTLMNNTNNGLMNNTNNGLMNNANSGLMNSANSGLMNNTNNSLMNSANNGLMNNASNGLMNNVMQNSGSSSNSFMIPSNSSNITWNSTGASNSKLDPFADLDPFAKKPSKPMNATNNLFNVDQQKTNTNVQHNLDDLFG
uniref:Protein kinase domain-containing protein n=1 Tax=Rhabditophanes sp. KR3021 TaxID=114890 RepID=A0AC35UHC6_9BILA